MKIGKYNFNKDMPRIVIEKRLLSLFSERIKRKWECRKGGEIGIGVTNMCNLNCFSCVSLCDTPLGSNTFRSEKYVMKPEVLDLFLERIDGLLPQRWITFTGGEPTFINPRTFIELVQVVKKHNRKLLLISNGFGINRFNPFVFDFIRLDNHGDSNKDDIKNSLGFLKSMDYKYYEVVDTLIHLDFHKALEEKIITDGLKCPIWLGLNIWGETVYPCCCLAQLDGFLNVSIIKDSLDNAGWNVNNPNLKDVIENWMDTVPSEVVRMCTLECWRGRETYDAHPVNYKRV